MKITTSFILLLFLTQTYPKDFGVHQVKKGETISTILYELGLYPLYGKKGWTDQILKLNRVTLKKSRTLEPGDKLIIPLIKKESDVLKDVVSLKHSGIIKSGILSRSSSKKYNFLIYTDIGKKNYRINDLEESPNNYNYGIGVELIGLKRHTLFKQEFSFSYGAYVNTQRSVSLGNSSNIYAQFSPEINIYSRALFRSSHFFIGPTLAAVEESVVDSDGTRSFVRRDRKLNLGLTFKYSEIENLLIGLGSYYAIYSQNLNDYENNKTLTSFVSADLNLINNFKVGAFGEMQAIDRKDSSYGIRLTKLFK